MKRCKRTISVLFLIEVGFGVAARGATYSYNSCEDCTSIKLWDVCPEGRAPPVFDTTYTPALEAERIFDDSSKVRQALNRISQNGSAVGGGLQDPAIVDAKSMDLLSSCAKNSRKNISLSGEAPIPFKTIHKKKVRPLMIRRPPVKNA